MYPALGGQGDPGAAAGRERRGRPLWFRRSGACAGLRLARRRAGACRAGDRMLARAALDAGALECGAHWPSSQEAQPSRWRARAGRRRRCTTTARANMRAFSVSPAGTSASIIPAMSDAGHPVQQRGAPHAGGGDRRRAWRARSRHRRLLDPDLGGAADGAGARVCNFRNGAGTFARARQGRGAHPRRMRGRSLTSLRARAASAARS